MFVPKGQLLDVRLERVGRVARARVDHVESRTPLNPRTPDGGLIVVGRSATGGDYRIEVVRTQSGGSDQLPYILSVALR